MSSPIRPPLTISDVADGGSVTGRPITTIEVSDGTLSVSGTTATLTIGGGSGTVSSVGLTETGTALTITGSPITSSGTINIAGAGTSSQVILGDLSLATLPTGTIGGSTTTNYIAFGDTSSDEITSSGNLQFLSGTNLYVGGRIQIGNATGTKLTTVSSQDLILDTNEGTDSGSIVIEAGTNGQISITPDGTGVVKIDGVGINNSAISTGYVLKATSATEAGWAAESSGGTPAGSDTYVQYNNGGSFGGSDRFKFDEDVGGSGFAGLGIKSNGAAFVSSGFVIYAEGNTYLSSQVFGNEFLCASSSSSDVGFGPQTDQDTGIAFSSADQVDIVTGAAYNISFGANKEILLGGTAAGSSGQVLTSGGAGAAVSWTTPSGGGISFPIEADSGSAGAPSYSFSADTDTGMYLAGSSNIGIVAAGNSYLSIGSLGTVQFDRRALFNAATEAAPNAFATDTNTGFYLESADVLALVEGGTTRLAIGRDNDIQTDGRIRINTSFGSSTTAPAISTTNDKNTGISFAVGGNTDTLSLINAGTETLRFGASGEILIGGTAAGTSGQVLTSAGASSAVEWSNPKALAGTPASSSATGKAGDLQYDSNYLYVCTAVDTWKRVGISSW